MEGLAPTLSYSSLLNPMDPGSTVSTPFPPIFQRSLIVGAPGRCARQHRPACPSYTSNIAIPCLLLSFVCSALPSMLLNFAVSQLQQAGKGAAAQHAQQTEGTGTVLCLCQRAFLDRHQPVFAPGLCEEDPLLKRVDLRYERCWP